MWFVLNDRDKWSIKILIIWQVVTQLIALHCIRKKTCSTSFDVIDRSIAIVCKYLNRYIKFSRGFRQSGWRKVNIEFISNYITCESAKIKVTWHYHCGFIINFLINTFSYSKFLMPRPLKWGILGTIVLSKDIHKYLPKINNKATMTMSSYFDFCWLTR